MANTAGWATMTDVARLSGVALKTVSRVVNGESNVSPATTAKVRAAMEELGYRRNESASLLRRGSATGSIGLVLEDSLGPFFGALVAAVERVARNNGFMLFTGGAEGDPTRAGRLTEAFLDRRVDGLILATSLAASRVVDDAVPAGIPAVFIERPSHQDFRDAVLADNAGGIAAAVTHLAAVGHRRIAYVGDNPIYYTAGERRQGFVDTVAALGLDRNAPVLMDAGAALQDGTTLSEWRRAPNPVTAVISGNNRSSRGLLQAMRAHDINDLGYVCFDEWDMADLMRPAVSTVDQNAAAIGAAAAERLFSRVGGADEPPHRTVVPTLLTVRESSTLGL